MPHSHTLKHTHTPTLIRTHTCLQIYILVCNKHANTHTRRPTHINTHTYITHKQKRRLHAHSNAQNTRVCL